MEGGATGEGGEGERYLRTTLLWMANLRVGNLVSSLFSVGSIIKSSSLTSATFAVSAFFVPPLSAPSSSLSSSSSSSSSSLSSLSISARRKKEK